MKQLEQYLAANHVKYRTIRHSTAYTAQQIAAVAHIPGKMLAKIVMAKLDGKLAMLVMPANERVDLSALCKEADCKTATLASEYEFSHQFKDCDTGAMPPFGNLWGYPVYVAKDLTTNEDIAFNAGSHTELIQMKFRDFEKLVKPKIVNAMH